MNEPIFPPGALWRFLLLIALVFGVPFIVRPLWQLDLVPAVIFGVVTAACSLAIAVWLDSRR